MHEELDGKFFLKTVSSENFFLSAVESDSALNLTKSLGPERLSISKKSNFFELLFLSNLLFNSKSSEITLTVDERACLSFSLIEFSLLLI